MIRLYTLSALLMGLVLPAGAHDPITTKLTWSREISRIVYRRCVFCHREGGSAPMPLVTWSEARPWAAAIAEEVLERRMPPWDAVKGFGEFKNDHSLSQEEILQLADWATGGAPEGDPALLPSVPSDPPPASPPARGAVLRLAGTSVLNAPSVLISIRPDALPAGSCIQITAERPDGSIEPLLWLRNFRPAFMRDYEFREPVPLPAGTRLRMTPHGVGSVAITHRPKKRAHASVTR